MTKNKTTQASSWGWAIVVLLPIVITIAVVTYLTPLMVDDFILRGNGHVFFAITDAWQYYKNIYNEWSGRIAHLLFGLFALSFYRAPFEENFSQIILSVLNGLAFVGLLLALFFLAFGRAPQYQHSKDRIRILLLFFLMMACLAKIGETVFWLNGRCVYLWMAVPLCWFMVFYRLQLANKNFLSFATLPYRHFFFLLFFLPLALVAGMTSEIGVPVVITLLTAMAIYKIFYTKDQLPLWCWLGFLFFIIGYVLLMIAPGNLVRVSNPLFKEFYQASFFEFLSSSAYHLVRHLVVFIGKTKELFLLSLLGMALWARVIPSRQPTMIKKIIDKLARDTQFAWASIFLCASVIFVALQIVNPAPSGRTFFVATIFFIISFAILLDHVFLQKPQGRLFRLLHGKRKPIFAIVLVVMGVCLSFIIANSLQFFLAHGARVAHINAEKEKGQQEIVLAPYGVNTYFWGRISNTEWVMTAMANYYGVKKITVRENK